MVTAASINNIPSSRIKLNSPDVRLTSPETRRVNSFLLLLAPLFRKRLIFSRRPTTVTVLELTSRYLKAMLRYTPVLRLWKTVVSTTAKLFDRSLDVHLSSTSAKLRIDRNWNENNRAKRESSLRRNSSLLVSEGRPPDNT